ncbi:MAG: hypothetical protein WCP69_14475 [Bacteroidota bacterium]
MNIIDGIISGFVIDVRKIIENEFPDTETEAIALQLFLYKHKLFLENFSANMNLSVIAGEYHLKNAKEQLFSNKFKYSNAGNYKSLYNSKYSSKYKKEIEIIDNYVQFSTSLYEKLIINSNIHLSNHQEKALYLNASREIIVHDYVVELNDAIAIITNTGDSEKFDKCLFTFNVKMAEIDDKLFCNQEVLSDLIRAKNVLSKDLEYSTIAKILLEKCKFLIFKISKRLSEIYPEGIIDDAHHDVSSPKNILCDDKIINIKHYKYFYSFFKDLELYYQNNNYPLTNNHSDLIKRLENKKIETLMEIHLLSKFIICQVKNNRSNTEYNYLKYFHLLLSELYRLKEKDSNKNEKFNNNVYIEAEILINCNEFKCDAIHFVKDVKQLILKKDEIHIDILHLKIKELEQKAEKIITFQEEYNFNIYFVYKILAEIYRDFFEIIKNINFKEYLQLKEISNNYYSTFNKLKNSLSWSMKNCIQPYYLPYCECVKHIKTESSEIEIDVFLDSAYILPINYKKKRNELIIFKTSLQDSSQYISEKIANNAIKDLKNQINQAVKETKDVINSTEKNQAATFIQLLGIFAAIITFVLGSISIYPKLSDINAIVFFMISFALSLILFVIGIQYIINNIRDCECNPNNKNIKSKKYSFNLITFCFLLLTILIYFLVKSKDSKIDTENDSKKIQIENNVSKSLLINEEAGHEKKSIEKK